VTLKDLVAHDFPDGWSSLLDDMKRLLGSGEVREVGAGVVAALKCIKVFRYVFYCVIFHIALINM
jgi:hypothetical protein